MLVAQISRQRDFGQAEPIRLAQQSMMQYVSKDSRRFSLGHAWSKTWKTQRGGSFLEPQLAAAISKSEKRFGSRDKREDSVRSKQMIASGWDGLWARWRDRLWESCAKRELTTAYYCLVSTKMNRFSRGLHSLTPNRPKSGLCIDILPCYVDHLTAWILLPLSLHGDLDEGRK